MSAALGVGTLSKIACMFIMPHKDGRANNHPSIDSLPFQGSSGVGMGFVVVNLIKILPTMRCFSNNQKAIYL
jgi:hypothetical protein